LILFGAPGVGKGTQSKLIQKKYQIPQISTGDMLRRAIRNKTELGLTVKSLLAKGELVPDAIMLELIRERISRPDCNHGFILDGFPRTLKQAEGLSLLMKDMNLPAFLCIEIRVPDDMIVTRLSNRHICENCGKDYNLLISSLPPDNICLQCGGHISSRQDDQAEIIKNRLKVYRELTEKVKDYYDERGLLKVIDGARGVDKVFSAIDNILQYYTN
jgi:adenylate kinase